jgi:hypothetical protein
VAARARGEGEIEKSAKAKVNDWMRLGNSATQQPDQLSCGYFIDGAVSIRELKCIKVSTRTSEGYCNTKQTGKESEICTQIETRPRFLN